MLFIFVVDKICAVSGGWAAEA